MFFCQKCSQSCVVSIHNKYVVLWGVKILTENIFMKLLFYVFKLFLGNCCPNEFVSLCVNYCPNIFLFFYVKALRLPFTLHRFGKNSEFDSIIDKNDTSSSLLVGTVAYFTKSTFFGSCWMSLSVICTSQMVFHLTWKNTFQDSRWDQLQ